MAYTNLQMGSTGEDVKKLQQALYDKGYVEVGEADGIFGKNTLAAVRQYQWDNGLDMDGIAGEKTQTKLYGTSNSNAVNAMANAGATIAAGAKQALNSGAGSNASVANKTESPAATTTPLSEFSYSEYTPSAAVTQAQALLQQQMANKPGEYQSTRQGQLNDKISQILNREKFSYDLNGDALYQQYADQYAQKGKMAMMDTMGQAQAMTGGYGNSYAQSAGQQAYQAYLQQLNEVVPELYGMALDQYNQEGQELYNQAALMAQMEDQEYGRYMDSMNAWLTERDYLAGRADSEKAFDYGMWQDNRDFAYDSFIDDRNYEYQLGRDAIADQQWNETFQYQQDRDKVADEQWQKQYDLAAKEKGVSDDSGGNDYDTHGYTKEQIMALQKAAGIAVDGIWGPETEKAYQDGYRPDSKPTYTLSETAKKFMSNLPYLHAGGSVQTWRNVVRQRLQNAYENGGLSASDVEALIYELKLDQ